MNYLGVCLIAFMLWCIGFVLAVIADTLRRIERYMRGDK